MRCVNPITIGKDKGKGVHVPCGRCMPCLRNKRRDWVFRLQEEQRASVSSYFITMTYREEEIPLVNDGPTLSKEHLRIFINKLRKYQDRFWEKHFKKLDANSFAIEWIKKRHRIRYYAVGEYGTKGDRPHYHMILFNLSPRMLEKLDSIWNRGS